MEKGTVKFFDIRENKRYGWMTLESGEEIFFHGNDGRRAELEGTLVCFTDQTLTGTPRPGDKLVFERGASNDGRPKASPWCWARVYDSHAYTAKVRKDHPHMPFSRYPWLERMFHFTSIDLKIDDHVRGTGGLSSRRGVKNVKIFATKVTPETVWDRFKEVMLEQRLAECQVLDKNGNLIGECLFYSTEDEGYVVSLRPEFDEETVEATGFHFSEGQQNLDLKKLSKSSVSFQANYEEGYQEEDVKATAYLVLSEFSNNETVVIYEVTWE